MAIVFAEARTELYLKCPSCGRHHFIVGHLKPGQKVTWPCDECGGHFHMECRADGVFIVERLKRRTIRTLVTLESTGPVRLIVKGMRSTDDNGNPDPQDDEHDEYFYNEHTCPVNFLGVEKVIDPASGSEDPHGIFAYVRTDPYVVKED